MSKSRGVFQILGGWMTSRGQCPRGGACGYLCKISGKSTPLPPLTKAFPYAYDYRGKADAFVLLLGIVDPLLAHPFQRLLSQPDTGWSL